MYQTPEKGKKKKKQTSVRRTKGKNKEARTASPQRVQFPPCPLLVWKKGKVEIRKKSTAPPKPANVSHQH